MEGFVILLPSGDYARLVKRGSFSTETQDYEGSSLQGASVLPKNKWEKFMKDYGAIDGIMLPAKEIRVVTIVTNSPM